MQGAAEACAPAVYAVGTSLSTRLWQCLDAFSHFLSPEWFIAETSIINMPKCAYNMNIYKQNVWQGIAHVPRAYLNIVHAMNMNWIRIWIVCMVNGFFYPRTFSLCIAVAPGTLYLFPILQPAAYTHGATSRHASINLWVFGKLFCPFNFVYK